MDEHDEEVVQSEWSQTDSHVMVSLLLECRLEDITLDWSDTDCTLKVADGRTWSCVWNQKVDVAASKAKLRGQHLQLKLAKSEPGTTWQQLQKVEVCEPVNSHGNNDDPRPLITATTQQDSPPSLVSHGLCHVQHVHYDWNDTGAYVLVKVLVNMVNEDSVSVDWHSDYFVLMFGTSDVNFASEYMPSDNFQWTVYLSGTIDASGSCCTVDQFILLTLMKSGPCIPWVSLENSESTCDRCIGMSDSLTMSTTNDGSDVEEQSVDVDQGSSSNSQNFAPENTEQPIFDSMTDIATTISEMEQMVVNDCSVRQQDNKLADESTSGSVAVRSDENCQLSQTAQSCGKLAKELCTTGIKNLGYSCFLSSVVQCLAHCRELRDHILRGYYKDDVNLVNPLGFEGELVQQFASIVEKLWSDQYKWITPRKLLRVFRSRIDQFNASVQQDAQEFMNFLLDGLHEDLNRIRVKPVTSPVEANGRPDQVVAQEAWLRHRKRNDSVIADLFQGQFRSTVYCPKCESVSVTFDPFMQISVPLPKQHSVISVIFMPRQHSKKLSRFCVRILDDAKVDQLLMLVAQKAQLSSHHSLIMLEVLNGIVHRILQRKSLVSELQRGELLIVTDAFYGDSDEESIQIQVYQTWALPPLPKVCSLCKREANGTAGKLQRCGRCFQVAYCSKNCQSIHWGELHRKRCGKSKRYIGLPFAFVLPASQATFSRITTMCYIFARRSVSVSHGSETSIQLENECTDCHKRFCLRRVNLFGNPMEKSESAPLQDNGGDPVVFEHSVCLAMEWQNNPNKPQYVSVEEQECLEFSVDEVAEVVHEPDDPVTLEQCLKLFTDPEQLTKTDAWYCSKCKEHVEAKKRMAIWRLPHNLVLHLKRFKYSGNLWRDKISSFVRFPQRELDLKPYLADEGMGDQSTLYDLFGVVYHFGAVFGGHYVAAVRLSNCKPMKTSTGMPGFYECDDESVKPLLGSPVNRSAYVLFYRRRGDFQPSISNELQRVLSDEDTNEEECHGGKGFEIAPKFSSVLPDDQMEQSISGCETKHNVEPSQYVTSDGRTSNGE